MSAMNSIINHVLISMPHMQDPFFGNSVVFMCEHDAKGAMGLIVNKPFRDPELSRLLLGHAGWSEGQLEREIENGDWLVQETSPDFIFKIPVEQMWGMAIQSFGIDIADFSTTGGQA